MRDYEVTVIFRAEDDRYKSGLEFVKNEFTRVKSEPQKEDDWGAKDLAYMIKKQERGHYHFWTLKMEPQVITDLDRSFRLNQDILKFMFIRKDD